MKIAANLYYLSLSGLACRYGALKCRFPDRVRKGGQSLNCELKQLGSEWKREISQVLMAFDSTRYMEIPQIF